LFKLFPGHWHGGFSKVCLSLATAPRLRELSSKIQPAYRFQNSCKTILQDNHTRMCSLISEWMRSAKLIPRTWIHMWHRIPGIWGLPQCIKPQITPIFCQLCLFVEPNCI
jgi:hypothetical protein